MCTLRWRLRREPGVWCQDLCTLSNTARIQAVMASSDTKNLDWEGCSVGYSYCSFCNSCMILEDDVRRWGGRPQGQQLEQDIDLGAPVCLWCSNWSKCRTRGTREVPASCWRDSWGWGLTETTCACAGVCRGEAPGRSEDPGPVAEQTACARGPWGSVPPLE